MNNRKTIISIICVLMFASAAQTTITIHADEETNGDNSITVVSMGDSYSSGEGLGSYYGETGSHYGNINSDEWLAHRSENSWPGQLCVSGLDGTLKDHKDINWFFTAISGDTTDGLREKGIEKSVSFVGPDGVVIIPPSDKDSENYDGPAVRWLPPQIDIFSKQDKVDYVTLTIGGNDAHFGNIVTSAFLSSRYLFCNDLETKLNTTKNDFPSLAAHLKKAYEAIASKTKYKASIIVAGYPCLFAERNISLIPLLAPELEEPTFGVSKEEAIAINEGVREFNELINETVNRSGSCFYFVDVADEFATHEAYSLEGKPYLNGIELINLFDQSNQDLNRSNPVSAASVHPNEDGAAAYAKCVQKKIDEIEKEKGTYVERKQATWVVKDALPISEVDELEQFGTDGVYAKGLLAEGIGYPTQWATNIDYYKEYYTADAISFRSGTNYGVIDYSGNILYPATLPSSDVQYADVAEHPVLKYEKKGNPIINYVHGPFFTVNSDVFHHDFADFDRHPGIGGTAPATRNYVRDGVIHREYEYGGTYDYEWIDPNREIINVIDSSGSTIGGAVVKDNEIISQFDGQPIIFVNGVVTYSQGGQYGFYSADNDANITGPEYEDAKYFVEDLAPVKKDGKWGYINKSGEAVTDFIFDDASTPYEGRVFVKVNGGYRILDLKTSLDDLGHISASSLGDLPQSEGESTIGKVTVNVSGLRVRTGPGTSYETSGSHVSSGSDYDVYEITEAEGFTWYRIGDNQWIADDGTWLTYTEN